jgi:hypothetical protein
MVTQDLPRFRVTLTDGLRDGLLFAGKGSLEGARLSCPYFFWLQLNVIHIEPWRSGARVLTRLRSVRRSAATSERSTEPG